MKQRHKLSKGLFDQNVIDSTGIEELPKEFNILKKAIILAQNQAKGVQAIKSQKNKKKISGGQITNSKSRDMSLVSVIQDLEDWHRDLSNTKNSSRSVKKGVKCQISNKNKITSLWNKPSRGKGSQVRIKDFKSVIVDGANKSKNQNSSERRRSVVNITPSLKKSKITASAINKSLVNIKESVTQELIRLGTGINSNDQDREVYGKKREKKSMNIN